MVRAHLEGYDAGGEESVFYLRHKQQVHESTSDKGLAVFEIYLDDGKNEIEIWVGEKSNPTQAKTADLYYKKDQTLVQIDLLWDTYNNGHGDAGDFDLVLINNETADSVYYKNKNPDWGIPGAEFDNPFLYDYTNPNGYFSGKESIKILAAARGSYTIKVNYFSNYGNPQAFVKPRVRLRVGDPTMNLLQVWPWAALGKS